MAWHKRGKHRYYYKSGKRNGQTYQRYYGRGLVAQMMAQADDTRRVNREAELKACRAMDTRLDTVEAPVAALEAVCVLIMGAVLLTAGFYRQDKHAWRRRHRA